MPDVVGIKFRSCGKINNFETNGIELHKGDLVVIESEFGLGIGTVLTGPRFIDKHEKEFKKVIRLAEKDDLKQKQENIQFEKEAKTFCLERIMARGLPMKLISTEITLDRKRIVFYFTADGRIDFRELVKDLAAKFKTRIEMRQIGVRDKAKLVGGLSLCGKELCCRLFLTSFEPISIRMAKQQELTLNTGKLSGACGRLMCCLGYEYNENGVETAPASDESTIAISEEPEIYEIIVKEPETTPADNVVCQNNKHAEQKKPENFNRPKRRRRRRPRKKSPETTA